MNEQQGYPTYPNYPGYPNDEESGAGRIDPDLIRDIWHRRRWVGMLVSAAVLACAVTAVLSLPSLYRATAKVLVNHQEVSETFVRPSITAELEPRIQTIRQQVMSRERLSNLITSLGLYPEERKHSPIEQVVERMRKDVDLKLEGLEANGRNATVAFDVSYNGRDPVTTAKVANTLAKYYVEENSRGRKEQAQRTAAFLGKQVQSLKAELEQHESRTGDYIRRNSSALPAQLGVNESALSRLSARLQINNDLQQRQLERRERIQREMTDSNVGSALLDTRTAESEISKMRQELAALKNQYSDRYPRVVQLSADIAAREAQLQRATTAARATAAAAPKAVDPAAFAEVDAQLQALRAEESSLRSQMGMYEKRVASTPSTAIGLDRLARPYETTRERYQALLKEYEDAQVAATLEQGDDAEEFRLLDAAVAPRDPVAPNRLWLLLVSVIAAAVAGAAAILIVEKLDASFHAPDDLRAFIKIPVLATIPRVVTVASTRRRHYQRVLAASAAVVVLSLLAAGSWYVAAGNEMITRLTTRGA